LSPDQANETTQNAKPNNDAKANDVEPNQNAQYPHQNLTKHMFLLSLFLISRRWLGNHPIPALSPAFG